MSVLAEQATTEFEKRFVNVSATFKANTQTAEMMQPSMRTLDGGPTQLPGATAVWVASSGNACGNVSLVKGASVIFVVAITVGVHAARIVQRPPTYATIGTMASTSGISCVTS